MRLPDRAAAPLADADDARRERPEIAAFLGCDRLAHPIADHCPDLVLHGHAHAGRFDGTIGSVPVFNVALPMKREFWVFELSADRPRAPEYALVG